MEIQEIVSHLKEAIMEGSPEKAKVWAKEATRFTPEVLTIFEEGLIKSIKKVGELFGDGELFLPDLILSSEAMKCASEILEEELKRTGKNPNASSGTIVIGTVKGDIHDIGKTLVATLFKAEGFKVIDLGVDVAGDTFIDAVHKFKPDLLGLSSLLTTSAEEQKHVLTLLEEKGLRSRVKVIVGGGAITAHWAKEIGADAYGGDARDAVVIGTRLLSTHKDTPR